MSNPQSARIFDSRSFPTENDLLVERRPVPAAKRTSIVVSATETVVTSTTTGKAASTFEGTRMRGLWDRLMGGRSAKPKESLLPLSLVPYLLQLLPVIIYHCKSIWLSHGADDS